mmetsp:Transcript_127233/g.407190  ORF Transcript_127233/g.407190 Transcript_127233/m.407190 type:complete len:242 (+) Transcript_127233:174-899(+)
MKSTRPQRPVVCSQLVFLDHLLQERDPGIEPIPVLRFHFATLHALQTLQLRFSLLCIGLHLLQNVALLLVVAALGGVGVALISRGLAALDLQDLHPEDEDIATHDLRRGAAVAVAEVARDVHLPLVALHHQLHGLGPARDHLVRSEGRGVAPLVRRVKLGPIGLILVNGVGRQARRRAGVVALAWRILGGVILAGALGQDLVLKTGGQSDHARHLGVLLQKLLPDLVGARGGLPEEEPEHE